MTRLFSDTPPGPTTNSVPSGTVVMHVNMAKSAYITGLARTIATVGGAGYSPVAPGTCGTAVAVPVAWALSGMSPLSYWLTTTLVIVVGIWAARIADESWGTHDSGRIVVDEVAGYLVTMGVVDRSNGWLLLAGFVVFRFFDIVKPPPVRWLDKNLRGGVGVVLDDVAAGIYGCIVVYGLSRLDWFAQFRIPA